MNLKNLGLPLRNSVINSFRALLLSCLAIALSSCAGTRAYNPTVRGITGNVNTWAITVNKNLSALYSYNAISGRLKSTPDDYVEITRQGPIIFFGHKNHLDATKAVLNKLCCHDNKTSADNIVRAAQWTGGLFDLDTDMQIEVLLVPDAYSYKYATQYKIKGKKAKVRFAFHFFDERPALTKTRFVEETVNTLTHELTHVYFQLSARQAKNGISDETTASAVGVCTRSLVTQKLRIPTTGILPKESVMQEISASADSDYVDTVNRLREKIQENDARTEYVDSMIGGILAELIAQKTSKKYGASNQLASDKILDFCQRIVTTRHDFTTSMGFEE